MEYKITPEGEKVFAESGEKVGRPLAEVDTDLLQKLAEIQCTNKEIAHCLGVTEDLVGRRFKQLLTEARDRGRMRLRRAMWVNAIDNENVVMQIWLSKNLLGYADAPKHDDDDTKPLPWVQADVQSTADEEQTSATT